jgi:ribosomal protein S21
MVYVNVSDQHDFDKALQKFKRKVRKAHILEIAQNKSYYLSPSERKHRNKYRRRK